MTVGGKRQAIVRLMRWYFLCLYDGSLFEADGLAEGGYGLASARTPSGLLAALVFDADPIWHEVADLVRGALKKHRLTFDTPYIGAFHLALSAALDPAPNGERYRVGRHPPCPDGHDPDEYVRLGRPAEPRIGFDRLVDLPEHTAWDALPAKEKQRRVEAIVADFLATAAERRERDDRETRRYRDLEAQGLLATTPRR